MKTFLSFVLLLTISFSSKSQLVINEYSCSNINTYLDAFGQYEDWVELYNNTASPINITGYYLSDDPNDLQKWQIPTVLDIAPNGRKMIIPSKRDLIAANGQIHPSFKLTQTHGNWIILSNASGIVVDSLHLQITQRCHSRGRKLDGGALFGIFTTPTPNASNNTVTAYNNYATKPIFNIGAGNFTSTQSINMTTPDPNVTIYYTTNGTAPIATSTPYTTPIAVSATVAIRARAISTNPTVLPSFIETNTYFINDAVDPRYTVVSLCGAFNTASALGGSSLFNNSTPAWSSLEYFDNNFNMKFEQEVQASRHGNDSWAYAQKGIDIEAFDETGTRAEFADKFFSTTFKDTFSRFILKNAGSDNYPLGPSKSCHLRDVFAQTLAEKYGLDMDYRRFRPSIVFINGQYWGVYDFRERVDKDYFKYYYGKGKDKVDHLSYWGSLTIRMGSDTGWNNLYAYIMNASNPMSVQSNYNHVKTYLNTKSFIQYFILNEYLVNHDWLNWNTMWWRGQGTSNPVKWRYVLWDEDAICGLNNANYTNLTNTGPTNNPCDASQNFLNNSSIKHTDMLSKLMQNPEFEQEWKDEWLNMLTGPLECTNILAHYDSIVAIFQPEMQRQITRWTTGPTAGSYADWQIQVDTMRNWIEQRCAFISQGLDTCYHLKPQNLKLNISPPNAGTILLNGSLKSPYVWSKLMDADTIYNLKATPTAGSYWAFDHWEKQEPTNSFAPNTTTDLVQYNFKLKDSVIAYFKYFNYDSVDVTFDRTPIPSGTITLNGFVIPSYPSTYTLDRRFNYNIQANGNQYFKFTTWTKNDASTVISPDVFTKNATFSYLNKETITAVFDSIPIPPPPPPLPTLTDPSRTVYIPNAFTPNKDGQNDAFKIKVGKDIVGMEMSIFNRFGNKVYQTNDIDAGWNGQYKNRDCETGVYQYLIQVKFRDNKTELFKGDVSLIR